MARSKRTRPSSRLAYQAAVCGLCRGPIDFPSGFFFDTEEALGIVHPDCMAYQLERGVIQPGDTIARTCGDFGCVNPAHLALIHERTTCRQDGWVIREGYVIGCTTDEPQDWEYDHFHAIIDASACPCRHDTAKDARRAHGQTVEA
jgi:hypothetical protein